MQQNNYVKYKKHAKNYFWVSIVSTLATLLIAVCWARDIEPFAFSTTHQTNSKIWFTIYLVFILLLSLIVIYGISVISIINIFAIKLEKLKTFQEESDEAKKAQLSAKKTAILLDVISLNKHLSYEIYQTSLQE